MNKIGARPSMQPCWFCKNYVDGCSWSKSKGNVPVEGWIAVPSVKAVDGHSLNTFQILYCPEFISDGTEGNETVNQAEDFEVDGKKLRKLIKSTGYSEARFCRLNNLSEDIIGRTCRGVSQPREYTLEALAEVFHISLENLKDIIRKD